MDIEYIVQTADTGEFVPVMASDRYQAMNKLADMSVETLYMESASPDAALSHKSTYARHLIRLKTGECFVLEQNPQPLQRDDVDKVYVNVELGNSRIEGINGDG